MCVVFTDSNGLKIIGEIQVCHGVPLLQAHSVQPDFGSCTVQVHDKELHDLKLRVLEAQSCSRVV